MTNREDGGKAKKCDEDCNGMALYTDGIFNLCLCKARLMNIFARARFVRSND